MPLQPIRSPPVPPIPTPSFAQNPAVCPRSAAELRQHLNIPAPPRSPGAVFRLREQEHRRRTPCGLHHVYVTVSAFLLPEERSKAKAADPRLDPLFGDTPLYTPPLLCGGPRRDCDARQTDTSDGPSPFLAIHFAWDFLNPHERSNLPNVSIMWTPYARLRRDAIHLSIGMLRHPRPAPASPPEPVSRLRAHTTAAAMLRFDIHYADLIRWLGGE